LGDSYSSCGFHAKEAELNNEVTRVPLSAIYLKMNQMSESKKVGPALIVSVLREAKKPLTTRQLQQEVQKIVPHCVSSNVIVLNLMRIRGTIKGKRTENSWTWWVEDKEESK
jgi:hypothetical protein